jgi:hypothetical protein
MKIMQHMHNEQMQQFAAVFNQALVLIKEVCYDWWCDCFRKKSNAYKKLFFARFIAIGGLYSR